MKRKILPLLKTIFKLYGLVYVYVCILSVTYMFISQRILISKKQFLEVQEQD